MRLCEDKSSHLMLLRCIYQPASKYCVQTALVYFNTATAITPKLMFVLHSFFLLFCETVTSYILPTVAKEGTGNQPSCKTRNTPTALRKQTNSAKTKKTEREKMTVLSM